jgi:hypothetical protein
MSYVVIRGCLERVNMDALHRWFAQEHGMTDADVVAVVTRLRGGRRFTVFLGEKKARRFAYRAPQWGLTGITVHDDDDMSEYPPPPAGFWTRLWRRLSRTD